MAKAVKKPVQSRAKRQKAIDRSMRDVAKAHSALELKLKKHKQVMSAMFYAL